MNTPQPGTARPRGRWQILLLGVIFLAPVLGATLLFFSGWRPTGQTNHGELIEPARAWPAVAMHDADGKPVAADPWAGHWNLLFVAGDDCDAACESALDVMHRLHLAQGKEADRVARVLVLLRAPRANLAAVLARFPGTVAWIAAPGTSPAWDAYFSAGAAGAADGSIRFVDPRGYYMMRFAAGSDPNGIRRDLARLLKLSKE
jgi:cytochrome oxidase Cu insertion factor (SCO1/SenC/PrrC family)